MKFDKVFGFKESMWFVARIKFISLIKELFQHSTLSEMNLYIICNVFMRLELM